MTFGLSERPFSYVRRRAVREDAVSRREFGAVRRLPSGRWQAKYRHPRTNQFIVAPNTFALKGDATRWLAGIQRDIESGTWMDPAWSAVTLEAYAATWLAQRTLAAAHGRALRGALGPLHPARARHRWSSVSSRRATSAPGTPSSCGVAVPDR